MTDIQAKEHDRIEPCSDDHIEAQHFHNMLAAKAVYPEFKHTKNTATIQFRVVGLRQPFLIFYSVPGRYLETFLEPMPSL